MSDSSSLLITQYSTQPNHLLYTAQNHIILQWNNNFIQVYDSNQSNTLLHTINLPSKQRLTTSIIQHNGAYASIINHNQLVQFNPNDRNVVFNDKNTYQLDKDVYNIHSTSHVPSIVCVHNDSSITFISLPTYHIQYIETHHTIQKDSSNIISSQLVSTMDELNTDTTSINSNFLFITRHNTVDHLYYLDIYNIKYSTNENRTQPISYTVNCMATHTLSSPATDSTISSISINVASRTINIMWSNSIWTVHQFAVDNKYRYGNMTQPIQLKYTNQLTCYATQSSISCRSISDSYVIVCGQSMQSNELYIISMWESTYATLQQYYVINSNTGEQLSLDQLSEYKSDEPVSKKRKSSRHNESVHNSTVHIGVSTDYNTTSVALPKCVIQCNTGDVHAQQISLSSVIGRMKQCEQWIKSINSNRINVTAVDNSSHTVITKLIDNKLTAVQFETIFNEYYNQQLKQYTMNKSVANSTENTGSIELTPIKQQKILQRHVLLNSQFIDTIVPYVQNCIQNDTDGRLHYCNVLDIIISTNCVTSHHIIELLPLLIQYKQDNVLCSIVIHVYDLTETQLIDILLYTLQSYYSTTDRLLDYTIHTQQSIAPIQQLFDAILSTSYSTVFMKNAIKILNVQQLQYLLQYLVTWIQCYYYTIESQLYKSYSKLYRYPVFEQLIDWCALVIDTHFSTLLLLSNTQQTDSNNTIYQLIQQLIYIVKHQHIPVHEVCESFSGFLQALTQIDMKQGRGQLIQIKTIKNYQVELLQL